MAVPGFGWGTAAFWPLSPTCPVTLTTYIFLKCFRMGSFILSGRTKCQSKDIYLFPPTTAQHGLLVWLLVFSLKAKTMRKHGKCRKERSGLWPKGGINLSFVDWGLYREEAGWERLCSAYQQALEAMGTACPSRSYCQALKSRHAHLGGFHSSGISHVSKKPALNFPASFLHSWS